MKYLFTLLALQLSLAGHARQTIREKVYRAGLLIIGSGATGIGAGIQSAKLGIKTLVIDSLSSPGNDLDQVDTSCTLGINGLYLEQLRSGQKPVEVVQQWVKNTSGLHMILGVKIKERKKLPDGWEVHLSDGRRILAGCLFEYPGRRMVEYLPGKFIEDIDVPSTTDYWPGVQYRTQVGIKATGNVMFSYPLSRFIHKDQENQIMIPSRGKGDFTMGQLVGVIAAIKVANPSGNINVRAIQKTLLTEGLQLNGYDDIKSGDPHYQVFQRIGATGLLMSHLLTPGGVVFMPDVSVNIKEIKPAFISYYPNSMVWFERFPAGTINLGEALDLLCHVTGKRFDEQAQIEWNSKLGLTGIFDKDRTVSRREFAVLIDTYLRPFDLPVDLEGKLVKAPPQ